MATSKEIAGSPALGFVVTFEAHWPPDVRAMT